MSHNGLPWLGLGQPLLVHTSQQASLADFQAQPPSQTLPQPQPQPRPFSLSHPLPQPPLFPSLSLATMSWVHTPLPHALLPQHPHPATTALSIMPQVQPHTHGQPQLHHLQYQMQHQQPQPQLYHPYMPQPLEMTQRSVSSPPASSLSPFSKYSAQSKGPLSEVWVQPFLTSQTHGSKMTAELELKCPIHLKSNHLSFRCPLPHPLQIISALCIVIEYIEGNPTIQLKSFIESKMHERYFVFEMDVPRSKMSDPDAKIVRIVKDRILPPRKMFGISQPIRCILALNVLDQSTSETGWSFLDTPAFVVVTHIDDAVQGLFGIGSVVYGYRDECSLINFALTNMALGSRSGRSDSLVTLKDIPFISRVSSNILGTDSVTLSQIVVSKQFSLLSRLSAWFGKLFVIIREQSIFELWSSGRIQGFTLAEEAENILAAYPSGTFLLRFSEDVNHPGHLVLSYQVSDQDNIVHHEIIKVTRHSENKPKSSRDVHGRISFSYVGSSLLETGVSYPSVFDLIQNSRPRVCETSSVFLWKQLLL